MSVYPTPPLKTYFPLDQTVIYLTAATIALFIMVKLSMPAGIISSILYYILIIIAIITSIGIGLWVANVFFNIDVFAYKDSSTPNTLDVVVDETTYQAPPVEEITNKKQVFNIPGNYYTFDEATAVCRAYGADLASYEQIESAYNKGAEWCNYGWSQNQLALFPTQQKTYDGLQTIPGHENDCGRPGVNGGFIDNKKVRFGANCYGYKPKITQEEENLMEILTPYPKTKQDMLIDKKVALYRNNIENILVSPFNYNKWSAV